MKLYHYVHCPFCIRVRLALGFLGADYKSIVLSYDDEKTPVDLCQKKMLPIYNDGNFTSNESLDIIKFIDKNDKLKTQQTINNYQIIENKLNELGNDIHSLAMPYFIWTPEFNESSRKYFQAKKEIKRGPFNQLVKNRSQHLESLNKKLKKFEDEIPLNITKDTITLKDILFASHLWGMYIVPEFQFSEKIHGYLQSVSKICNFEYHKDFWS